MPRSACNNKRATFCRIITYGLFGVDQEPQPYYGFDVKCQSAEIDMSETISRRRILALLGLATLSLTVPAALTVSDAEAQQPTPPATPQTGTERRQERRIRRTERRQERRSRRQERRLTRREGRRTRREVRREGRTERREERRDAR